MGRTSPGDCDLFREKPPHCVRGIPATLFSWLSVPSARLVDGQGQDAVRAGNPHPPHAVRGLFAWCIAHQIQWVHSIALLLACLLPPSPLLASPNYEGVDKTVVEKFAADAGRPPQKPLIDTDRGDLLLFLFLTAGAAGGFIAGYAFRSLFPPKKKS